MNGKRILAFGAHPDDIEFGCGPFLLDSKANGASIDLVVFSKGEAGTYGDPFVREAEATNAAEMLGATIQFPDIAGDTQLRATLEATRLVADIIRKSKADIVLAPCGHLNQHPDHREMSLIVRDANRLARYGKTPGLQEVEPHSSELLLFYDITSAVPSNLGLFPIILDVSEHKSSWEVLMRCHASQTKNMDYVELQLARARALGVQMGVSYALTLYSESPLMLSSSSDLNSLKGQRF